MSQNGVALPAYDLKGRFYSGTTHLIDVSFLGLFNFIGLTGKKLPSVPFCFISIINKQNRLS